MRFFSFMAITIQLMATVAYGQGASDCKHRILLLPQTHPTVLSGSLQIAPEHFEQTARSQFAIAKYLEQHKNLPVFSEQISSDATLQSVSPDFRKAAAIIKTMFPNGLPAHYEDLTQDQKTIIARACGDAISFILRNTDMLHRVVPNDQVEDQLVGKISAWAQKHPTAIVGPPEIENMIFGVRENLALDQINNYFKSNPSQRDVVLTFGSDHYFSFLTHPDKFNPQCILVPYEFQSAITSPYGAYNSKFQPAYGPSAKSAPAKSLAVP